MVTKVTGDVRGVNLVLVYLALSVCCTNLSFFFLDMKLMHGDELRLRYLGELHKPWSGVGHVIKIPDNFGEEVGIELKNNSGAPTDCISHFVVDFIWKSTSFDRLVCF